MSKKPRKYKLTRDIVIPAGTVVSVDGPKRSYYAYELASILMAESNDSTSEWHMPLDEALELGIVEPSEQE